MNRMVFILLVLILLLTPSAFLVLPNEDNTVSKLESLIYKEEVRYDNEKSVPISYEKVSSYEYEVLEIDTYQSEFYGLFNEYRDSLGLQRLVSDARLVSSSSVKLNDMIDNSYWSHIDSKGQHSWVLIGYQGFLCHLETVSCGENLGLGKWQPSRLLQAWKDSPSHNDLLTNPSYSRMGLSYRCGVNLNKRVNVCLFVLHLEGE